MAETAIPHHLMSVEEYLEFERNSPVKHEYVGGRLYAMVGVSRRHSKITGKIFLRLADSAEGSTCRVHQSDMQVPTPDGPYYYPDIVVACGPEPDDPYIEDAPCLLVEVISPTTELVDRREKLLAYRRIPTLQAYLIVEQDRMAVERHWRSADGLWQSELSSEGTVPIPCPKTTLPLADIYDGVQ